MPDKKMGIDERYSYLKVQYARYHAADRRTKSSLLVEMATVLGMHIKSVNRLMCGPPPCRHPRQRQRSRVYGAKVEHFVRLIDEALDQPCRERLKPMLPYLADHLCALGLARCDSETRELLESISVSTVGRMITRIRQDEPRLRRRAGTSSVTQIQAQVPIHNIPWDETVPGHLECDLVYHSGPSAAGDFVYTLQMVDVATGWSECVAILGRSYRVMRDAFERCLARIPFPVLEVHTDNGAEFLNGHLLRFWRDKYNGVALSRTRPYHSQDNRFVEQRNGGLIRALLGHDRLDTAQQTLQLNRAYAILWRYFNFFQPVMRQTAKTQDAGRIRRAHDDIRTPFQRVSASQCVPPEQLQRLQTEFEAMNPFALKQDLDHALTLLFRLPGAQPGHTQDVFQTLETTTA